MKAAVYIAPSKIEVRDIAAPKLKDGDLLLRVAACGLCGTDIHKIRHGMDRVPAVLGHEVAGEVVGCGPGGSKFHEGDRLVVAHHTPCYSCHYCRHGSYSMCRGFKESNLDPGGFAEFVRVPRAHAEMTSYRIPDGMSYHTAIFMEPLACAIRNLKRTTVLPGDTVAVVGLGAMGLMTGQLVRRIGGRVIATDLLEPRREIARRLSFEGVLNADDPRLRQSVLELTEGRGADLVVLTAGTRETYDDAVELVRDGGSISVFAGLAPGVKVSYEVNELYKRELTVFASYSSSPTELTEALEHLGSGSVNVNLLTSKAFSLEQVPDAVEAAMGFQILKAIIQPHGGRS